MVVERMEMSKVMSIWRTRARVLVLLLFWGRRETEAPLSSGCVNAMEAVGRHGEALLLLVVVV